MASSTINDIVIIGAGECGIRTALALRENAFSGTITLVGAEQHLPYERPPLSKDILQQADQPVPRSIVTADQLAEANINFLPSVEALSIDRLSRQVRLSDNRALAYDRLLLATGAAPRQLPMAATSRHSMTLRTYDDALHIRTHLHRGVRLAIIGGGFIGLEIAASARKLGCAVTVIETQSRILMRGVPAEIAEVIHHEHERHGVRFICGRSIASITDIDDHVQLALADGESVDADLVVIGIGSIPNTSLAEQAGLAIDNGIAVDIGLTTSDPAIFAAGDCCSFPIPLYGGRRIRLESWRNTHDQARIAASNMLGGEQHLAAVPWFWSDQYDLGLQVAGLADAGTTTARRDLGDGAFILFSLDARGILVAASGIGTGNAVARDIRIAEMLIARGASPAANDLAAPAFKLKALLAS